MVAINNKQRKALLEEMDYNRKADLGFNNILKNEESAWYKLIALLQAGERFARVGKACGEEKKVVKE